MLWKATSGVPPVYSDYHLNQNSYDDSQATPHKVGSVGLPHRKRRRERGREEGVISLSPEIPDTSALITYSSCV